MVRALSWMSFGIVFLMISPKLREVALECVAVAVDSVVKYSPWSYIAAVTGVVIFAVISNYRRPSSIR
jgi:hypothetical protein